REWGASTLSVPPTSVSEAKCAPSGRMDADAGRHRLRDPRWRGPDVDDEVADFLASHVDRMQDDPGMRDSHDRRSHSAPSSGLSLHVHYHRQDVPVRGIPTPAGNVGPGFGPCSEGYGSRRPWSSAAAKAIREGRPFGPR